MLIAFIEKNEYHSEKIQFLTQRNWFSVMAGPCLYRYNEYNYITQ